MLFPHSLFAFSVQKPLAVQVKDSDIIVVATIIRNVATKLFSFADNESIHIECRTETIFKGNITKTFSFNYIENPDDLIPFKNGEKYLLFLQKKEGIITLKFNCKNESSYDLSHSCKAIFKVRPPSPGKPSNKMIYVTPDFLLKRVMYINFCYDNDKEIQGLALSILNEPVLGQSPQGKNNNNLEVLSKKALDAFKKGDLRTAKAYCMDILAIIPYDKQTYKLLKSIISEEMKVEGNP